MQADRAIFAYAVVEATGFPRGGEEGHRDCLAEVVELEAGAADGREDGGVGDCVCWDAEGARAEEEVGVSCCPGTHSAGAL